ncbi:MAG: hypothetical protein M1822_003986 [Bathelium mastoideum]|nr:MAG: hypothetical protein M1822_003986 [Bathelium mastoideum]
MSLWTIPGLDKNTFYAAALYLHVTAGSLESSPLVRRPKTPQATRDFLDHLADCFARSKRKDARDHVSATAMVRNDEAKTITLYIAKNQSEKGGGYLVSEGDTEATTNENVDFAKSLVGWFNELASGKMKDELKDSEVFETMCNFSSSRVEYYIEKISNYEPDDLERIVSIELEDRCQEGWKTAKRVINRCKQYQNDEAGREQSDSKASQSLITLARLGGVVRKDSGFKTLRDKVQTSTSPSKLKNLPEFVKWIEYLGRLYSAWTVFLDYCRAQEQTGYHFEHRLLHSQEDEWSGSSYLSKIQAWTRELGLAQNFELPKVVDDEQVSSDRSLEVQMAEIVKSSGNVARVHCEMQQELHFSKPGEKPCLDYFGCSKKSCWLCWQMILRNSRYSTKGTHRRLYPQWAFPFDFSPLQRNIATGLRAANNRMLLVIRDNVIRQRAIPFLSPFPQSSAQSSARATPQLPRRASSDPNFIDLITI